MLVEKQMQHLKKLFATARVEAGQIFTDLTGLSDVLPRAAMIPCFSLVRLTGGGLSPLFNSRASLISLLQNAPRKVMSN